MKKVGKEVLFLAPCENNPRNGEGSFIRLNNGTIMYAYTKFRGGHWGDECTADIVAVYSDDEGETWGNERIIVEHTDYSRNTMCPHLVRMKNGNIGMCYGRKYNETGFGLPHFMSSSDEGESWCNDVICTDVTDQYYVMENDHMIVLSDGRLLLPGNHHPFVTKADGTKTISYHGKMLFFASDDNGATWNRISEEYDIPFPETSATGLQETMVYERLDGSLRAFSRTDMFCQYESTSDDRGATWTTPKPNRFFSSPDAPMLMKRIMNGKAIAAIFNPIPKYNCRGTTVKKDGADENWGRTPFIMALSFDDGKTFTKKFFLEDDLSNGYCYPSIFDGGDYMLVGYYHSNGTGIPLNSNKMIKIMYSELD